MLTLDLNTPMEISEDAGQTWLEMPTWVRYFLDLGYRWPRNQGALVNRKTIRIISLPNKTPVAGLVALGAVTADYINPKANDKDRHFETFFAYARQYLIYCQNCNLRCQPEVRKCGYLQEASGFLRHKDNRRTKWYISRQTDFAAKILRLTSKPNDCGATLTPENPEWSYDYYVDDGVPLHLSRSAEKINVSALAKIFPDAVFCSHNLSTSYSSICFAGGAAGQIVTRAEMQSLMFKDNTFVSLANLLPIYGWIDGTQLSRLIYYSSRGKGSFDQISNSTNLVIADGIDALSAVLSEKRFKTADVIAVVSRINERDKLEELGALIENQLQWYDFHELGALGVPGCYEIELRKRVVS